MSGTLEPRLSRVEPSYSSFIIFSAIFSLSFTVCGLALVMIALNTDYWITFRLKGEAAVAVQQQYSTSPVAYSRHRGLFRECFDDPMFTPPNFTTYLNLFGHSCFDILRTYTQIPENSASAAIRRIHTQLLISVVVCGVSGILSILIAVPLVICSLGSRKPQRLILSSGILLVTSVILLAAAAGLFHSVDTLQRETIRAPQFVAGWPERVRINTLIVFGWSYFFYWAGMVVLVMSALATLIAYCIAKSDSETSIERDLKKKKRIAVKPVSYKGKDRRTHVSDTLSSRHDHHRRSHHQRDDGSELTIDSRSSQSNCDSDTRGVIIEEIT